VDICLILYALLVIVCSAGLVFCHRRPYLWLLFIALWMHHLANLNARIYRDIDPVYYYQIMGMWFWNVRLIPELIMIGLVVGHSIKSGYCKGEEK